MEIKELNIKDERYPYLLKNIYDPPKTLYYIGDIDLVNEKCISIVGARECSRYGMIITEALIKKLVRLNYIIVSGFAYGIDTCAHKYCIRNKGKTIAVMASSLDIIYPKTNIKLFENIINSGGLIISEYKNLTSPTPEKFPLRNRIIAGLSLKTIVIEAKENSGALITANYAIENGRDVYAVPGNIFDDNSKGTNKLIAEGAMPIIKL